jgi:hypothetical protein
MARQKKPKQNILIEFVAWIFKWILKIILFLAILGGLLYGGYYLKQEYDKSKRLKARDCLAKEIPVLEQGIYQFRDSINPSSTLKDVVDIVFYEDTVVSSGRGGYKIKEMSNRPDIPEKDKKGILEIYEKYEKSRYEDIQVTDADIKRNVLAYSIKTKCDSDFNFLINIDDNQDRSLDRFRVWANNSPKGYKEGYLKKFYRNFSNEVAQKSIDERKRKNKKIQEKKRKKKEEIDARNRIKIEQREKETAKKKEQKYLQNINYSLGGKYNPVNSFSMNQYCKNNMLYMDGDQFYCNAYDGKRIYIKGLSSSSSSSSSKGGYDPTKPTSNDSRGKIHEF